MSEEELSNIGLSESEKEALKRQDENEKKALAFQQAEHLKVQEPVKNQTAAQKNAKKQEVTK